MSAGVPPAKLALALRAVRLRLADHETDEATRAAETVRALLEATPASSTETRRALWACAREVARALPFQFTIEPETNPVPFTVSVNPAAPGLIASGTRGRLISGMGFFVAANPIGIASRANTAIAATHITFVDRISSSG